MQHGCNRWRDRNLGHKNLLMAGNGLRKFGGHRQRCATKREAILPDWLVGFIILRGEFFDHYTPSPSAVINHTTTKVADDEEAARRRDDEAQAVARRLDAKFFEAVVVTDNKKKESLMMKMSSKHYYFVVVAEADRCSIILPWASFLTTHTPLIYSYNITLWFTNMLERKTNIKNLGN